MSFDLERQVVALKAAADPSRMRLLNICRDGEFTVSELTRILGQSQPRVSRHLRTLCQADLLLRFRERHYVFYRVTSDPVRRELVRAMLSGLSASDPVLQQDEEVMARVRAERDERAREVLATVEPDQIEPVFPAQLAKQICDYVDLTSIGDLLDIGTGSGRVLQLLGAHAKNAIGIDISSDSLTVARSNLGAAGLGRVMVRHGDMYRLPYDDHAFDTVTLDSVLSQATSPRNALAEAARTLRPGGVLLVIEVKRDTTPHAVTQHTLHDWASTASLALQRSEHLAHPGMPLDLHFVGSIHDAAAA